MMGKPVLVLTVGLPRSGKSSWARKTGWPIVCPDEIRLALHGQRFIATAEPTVWATAHLMVNALFGAGHNVVILDATNIAHKRRDEWKDLVWQRRYELFQTSKETCLKRAELSERLDLIPVIERMAESVEWPEPSEEDGG